MSGFKEKYSTKEFSNRDGEGIEAIIINNNGELSFEND